MLFLRHSVVLSPRRLKQQLLAFLETPQDIWAGPWRTATHTTRNILYPANDIVAPSCATWSLGQLVLDFMRGAREFSRSPAQHACSCSCFHPILPKPVMVAAIYTIVLQQPGSAESYLDSLFLDNRIDFEFPLFMWANPSTISFNSRAPSQV